MVKKWKVKIPELSGDKERRAYIYLPASYAQEPKRRYPVLYMFDGHNVFFDTDATYGKSWGMNDYMMKGKKQLIIVAVECNHEGNSRLVEYSPFDSGTAALGKLKGKGRIYMNWLVRTLKPYIDSHYRTLPDRKNTLIAGSSMGGLMALYAATTYNHVFQRAACLSPSLWTNPGKVYMSYGSEEMFNHAANAEALTSTTHMLLTKQVNLAFRIVPGGTHSEASWEKEIPFFMECLGID